MVGEAFAQTQCGEGTHSVTKDGILTCVLDNKPTGSFSGITPSLDFSNPDAIQQSVSETLLPNLINLDKLGNVAEASPIVFDILVWLTSLSGIVPIFAGGMIGIAFLIRKMKKDKMQNNAKSGVLQYLCMKCDTEMKEADYLEYGGLCKQHRIKKKFKLNMPHIPKMTMPKINLNLKKKSKDSDLDVIHKEMDKRGIDNKEDYDKMMKEVEPPQPESYEEYLQQEIASQERDLEVITDPDEAVEVMKDIEDMVDEKKELEEKKFDSPEEALIDSLDPAPTEVKDPEETSVEELDKQIEEKGHKVEVSDGQLDITQNPEIIDEKKPELELLKEHVEESASAMEEQLDEAIDEHDFEPSDDEIKEAQEKFENEIESNTEPEQEPPNEDDIVEVQRLMEEGMTQDEAIQQVISTKVVEEPKQVIEFVQKTDGEKTIEEQHEAQDIDEMTDERDIFKLDIPKKKQSPLQKKLSNTALGKKIFKNTDMKQKEKERNKETRQVLNDLGEQRMLEYASKIDDKLQSWATEQLHHTYEQTHKTDGKKNLSPDEIEQELKKFALFASMCEMMADSKKSKKRYWKRTNKYVKAT